MSIPYRVRKGLSRFLVALMVLAIVAVVGLSAWFVWLSRFVVYTENGVEFDFQLGDFASGVRPEPDGQQETVKIQYGEEDNPKEDQTGLKRLTGYSVTLEMLTSDFDAVVSALETLPKGSTVMLEMKNLKSEYLYACDLGRVYSRVDIEKVAELIETLKKKNCYLIASIPSFQEYWYILDDQTTRVPYGLAKKGGNGSLWLDSQGSNYWMDPTSSGTLNHLVQVITQLRDMGFQEVLLRDFRFPNTDKIKFSGDKKEALNQAAQTLTLACANESFVVSFGADVALTLPEGYCRLYLSDVAAADIQSVIGQTNVTDPEKQMVFLTDLQDTRFDQYGVLRPLEIQED